MKIEDGTVIDGETIRNVQGQWPLVLPNDDGIRPAGKPGECFYCHQKVGIPHAHDCVTVVSVSLYEVYEHPPGPRSNWNHNLSATGKKVGTWLCLDPFFWDQHDCEFHKNEGSFCASNAVEDIVWSDLEARDRAVAIDDKDDGGCNCGRLEFKLVDQDQGPFIIVKREGGNGHEDY